MTTLGLVPQQLIDRRPRIVVTNVLLFSGFVLWKYIYIHEADHKRRTYIYIYMYVLCIYIYRPDNSSYIASNIMNVEPVFVLFPPRSLVFLLGLLIKLGGSCRRIYIRMFI